jgi:hypothetical protein
VRATVCSAGSRARTSHAWAAYVSTLSVSSQVVPAL